MNMNNNGNVANGVLTDAQNKVNISVPHLDLLSSMVSKQNSRTQFYKPQSQHPRTNNVIDSTQFESSLRYRNNNNTNNNVISKNRNNWDCFHEKSFLLESHWFVHCGNACIWRDQYVFETSSYELKINGGEKYNVSINKIYNIDDIVLVIVDCISAAEGIIFQTDHLDQIEDKIQDLLKTMSYIQFRLKDMNKDNVDGIKLILSDAMIERNNTHCNYKGCLKSIMKLSKVLCRGCRSIYYCCKKCQKLDWKRHRYRCFRNRLSTERHSLKNKRYLFDWA